MTGQNGPNEATIREIQDLLDKRMDGFRKVAAVAAVVTGLVLSAFLIWAVLRMPAIGDPNNPVNNEVYERYVESGLAETGAVNIVAGMILDYRAFDTFGESCVLFVASCIVIFLLRLREGEDEKKYLTEAVFDSYFEPGPDTIQRTVAKYLVPMILVLGIYIVLNGHISPGGGFSGGAVIGSGMILYLIANGYEKAEKIFSEKIIGRLTCGALTFYCLAKSYSFYTGANHLHSIITPGTPGMILSAGLIVYLNICVGIVVACTMYSFYTLFRKGGY